MTKYNFILLWIAAATANPSTKLAQDGVNVALESSLFLEPKEANKYVFFIDYVKDMLTRMQELLTPRTNLFFSRGSADLPDPIENNFKSDKAYNVSLKIERLDSRLSSSTIKPPVKENKVELSDASADIGFKEMIEELSGTSTAKKAVLERNAGASDSSGDINKQMKSNAASTTTQAAKEQKIDTSDSLDISDIIISKNIDKPSTSKLDLNSMSKEYGFTLMRFNTKESSTVKHSVSDTSKSDSLQSTSDEEMVKKTSEHMDIVVLPPSNAKDDTEEKTAKNETTVEFIKTKKDFQREKGKNFDIHDNIIIGRDLNKKIDTDIDVSASEENRRMFSAQDSTDAASSEDTSKDDATVLFHHNRDVTSVVNLKKLVFSLR